MNTHKSRAPEPRWPVVAAAVGVGFLYYSMPEQLTYGPGWLLLAITLVLLVPGDNFSPVRTALG